MHRFAPIALSVPLLVMTTLAASAPPKSTEAAPTWARDVAPILYKNCVTCHRADSIAPFALNTFEEARDHAANIAQVVATKQMPPWKPVAGHGVFKDTRRLTAGEITTLTDWAKTGRKSGDLATVPKPPVFPVGWTLGKPDMILEMPGDFAIPADGRDVYQHFVFPLNLTQDRYVRGIEVRVGNPKVAHHAVGILDGSGTARKLDAATPEMGYSGLNQGFLPIGFTPGYVPGQTVRFFDESMPMTLKKGTDLVLQMHYHPIGKPQTDHTKIGIWFTDKKPTKSMGIGLLASESIDIPAGEKGYTVRDAITLPAPMTVTSIWAHMHLIGKNVRVWAELPGGTTENLLLINDWDFNWQDTYQYAVPLRLPEKTVIRAEWTFDNTASNPRNPNSPPKGIVQGENSTDEMAGLVIGGVSDNWVDELKNLGANIGHYFEMAENTKKFKARNTGK